MLLQASSPAAMEQFEGLPVAETLQRISTQLGCSPTAGEVAAFLDQHDQLRPLRDNFLLPKIQDLPPCESDSRKQTCRSRRSDCWLFLQLISHWWTAARNASTWWGTLWGSSPGGPGATSRRSWTSGPRCKFLPQGHVCQTEVDPRLTRLTGACTDTCRAPDPGPGRRTTWRR